MKKNRKNKADKEAAAPIEAESAIQPEEQPVSENLVTPGDSSDIVDSAADLEDMKPSSGGDVEDDWNKSRKPRLPRKPRKQKEPKEPKESKKKDKEAKLLKESKEPKEAKSKTRKKKEGKEAKDGTKRSKK